VDDLSDVDRGSLRFLATFAPGTYHHCGDWPPGRTAGLEAMERDGLVTQRPMAKHARSPSNYWTITDAGRATYAANPLPPIPRRK